MRLTRLSCWSQIGPRAYVRFALCFPLADGERENTIARLRAALDRMSDDAPYWAGGLRTCGSPEDGAVWLQDGKPGQRIRLDVKDVSDEVGFKGAESYADLERGGFAPGRFVGPAMDVPPESISENPIPVVMVKAMFVKGGLLLAVYLHHNFGDGSAMDMFLRSFSAATRGETVKCPTSHGLTLPDTTYGHPSPSPMWEQQLRDAPEWTLLDGTDGPAQPIQLPGGTPLRNIRTMGKTFVVSLAGIERLKQLIVDSSPAPRRPPSGYTALAALVWAHTTKARMRTSAHHAPPQTLNQHGRIITPVDWRSRAFPGLTENYMGNTILQVLTEMPVAVLRAAAGDDADADATDMDADAALARIAAAIESTINGIDDHLIRRRTELFDVIPDYRRVGLALDLRAPQNLHFNTWRRFGGNTRWQLADGQGVVEPEAVRRVQGGWNLGGSLVLPAVSEKAPYEICIAVEEEATEALCTDEWWMRWVDRVVG